MSRRRLSEPSFAFLLNAPALLAIVGLVGYPIAYSLWLSLHRYNLKRPNLFRFIGFGNYVEIFGSDEFWGLLAERGADAMEGLRVMHSKRRERDRGPDDRHGPLNQTDLERHQTVIARRVEMGRRRKVLDGNPSRRPMLRLLRPTLPTHEVPAFP